MKIQLEFITKNKDFTICSLKVTIKMKLSSLKNTDSSTLNIWNITYDQNIMKNKSMNNPLHYAVCTIFCEYVHIFIKYYF